MSKALPTSHHGRQAVSQIAALPYRTDPNTPDDPIRVLLITSRETKRWVLPKGNPIDGLAPHQAAAHEAFEEAGVHGIACPDALGSFQYFKRRKNGELQLFNVAVFPLAFTHQAEVWPECDQRDAHWFTIDDAADAVEEPELKTLILSFRGAAATPTAAMSPALRWAAQHRDRTAPLHDESR